MPTLGYNAHRYLTQLRHELERGGNKAGSSFHYTDPWLLNMLNVQFEAIQDRMDFSPKEATVAGPTAGTESYPFPTDLFSYKVQDIRVAASGGFANGSVLLTQRNRDFMRETYNLEDAGTSQQGTPADWSVDPGNKRNFSLRPIPSYTVSSGIRIDYIFRPSPFGGTAVWRPGKLATAITAAVTNGSATVTLNAAHDTSFVAAGDAFGVIPTKNRDEAAIADESPIEWYEVLTAVTTAITLTETYTGETIASGANVIFAKVHDLEADLPGKLGWAPVWLAAADILDADQPQTAQTLRQKAERKLEFLNRDIDEIKTRGPRAAIHTNMLLR